MCPWKEEPSARDYPLHIEDYNFSGSLVQIKVYIIWVEFSPQIPFMGTCCPKLVTMQSIFKSHQDQGISKRDKWAGEVQPRKGSVENEPTN